MVVGFSRSFSHSGTPAAKKSYHIRSISLPCRSHPLISHLEDHIRSINTWLSSQHQPESAWLCDGLVRLELLHLSLNDLLQLPQNQESLPCGSGTTKLVLDHFLRLADSFGNLRSEMVGMNDNQSAAQIAIRRKDDVKLASCVRSMKKTERQLVKLAASLPKFTNGANIQQADQLAVIIMEVINTTVSALSALFIQIAGAVSAVTLVRAAVSCSSTKSRWMSMKKMSLAVEEEKEVVSRRNNAMEKLQEFEECIVAVEKKSQRVFRCLLNTRVTLLGSMSP